MREPIDQFSVQSKVYKKFRPTYPKNLYEYIFNYVPRFENCWDCATGNGQVANILADYYDKVYASDISTNQIKQAVRKGNIKYSVHRAESTNYPDGVFDLITVGQALHWLDFESFNREVRRVLRSDGVLAVWGYGLFRINEDIDEKIDHFYNDIVGPYWAFERSYVDSRYTSIPLDIVDIDINRSFSIEVDWSIEHLAGYLTSWSAVQNYIKTNGGNDPVPECIAGLNSLWSDTVKVRIPLFLRMGKLL